MIGFLILGLALEATIPLAYARPFRVGNLPDKGVKFGCGTCHVNPAGGGSRNPFGADYEKIGTKADEARTGFMEKDLCKAKKDLLMLFDSQPLAVLATQNHGQP